MLSLRKLIRNLGWHFSRNFHSSSRLEMSRNVWTLPLCCSRSWVLDTYQHRVRHAWNRSLCPRQSHRVHFCLRQKIQCCPPSSAIMRCNALILSLSINTKPCKWTKPSVSLRFRQGVGRCANATPGHIRSNVAYDPTASQPLRHFIFCGLKYLFAKSGHCWQLKGSGPWVVARCAEYTLIRMLICNCLIIIWFMRTYLKLFDTYLIIIWIK